MGRPKPHPSYNGNRGGECTAKERAAHLARVGSVCPYCGVSLVGVSFAIDHIKPQRAGGQKSPRNQVACCIPCNSSKGSKTLSEWCAVKGMPNKAAEVRKLLARKLPLK